MATITLKGNPIHTMGELPAAGSAAPDFQLVQSNLSVLSLDALKGKKVVLNIFPSLDTDVCAASVRRFNAQAAGLDNTVVVCVSKDLPFAHKRFCVAEGIENVLTASDFRDGSFGEKYGITITDGIFAGLLGRAVVILNEQSEVIYNELVPEIAQEPDYEKAINALS